jgi:hypothetical protein
MLGYFGAFGRHSGVIGECAQAAPLEQWRHGTDRTIRRAMGPKRPAKTYNGKESNE